MLRKLLIVLLASALSAGAGVAIVNASEGEPPPVPWAKATEEASRAGLVVLDPAKVPATLLVAGPDGEPLRCANGELLRVRPGFGSPPSPALAQRGSLTSAGPLVPRCGPGPDGDRSPLFVPVEEDPLRR